MKINILFLILVLPLWSAAQLMPIPMPLTDSVSDNRNPEIILLNNSQAFMVWEKSNGPDSTALYGKIIHASGMYDTTSFKIIGKSGVHFTNPQLMFVDHSSNPGQDTLLNIYFESDESGNQDILCLKYTANGNFYGPFPFAVSPEDDENLSLSDSYYSANTMLTWQRGDKVLYASATWSNALNHHLISNPMQVDSGDVSHPVIDYAGSTILWEKKLNGVSKVAFSIYDNTSQNWSIPVIKNIAGSNSQISQVKGLWGMDGGAFLWRSADGNQTHLFGQSFSPWSPDSLDIVSNFNITYPCASFAPMIIKNSTSLNGLFVIYDSDSLGNDEVFWSWLFFSNYNVSNSPAQDVHPKLFMLPGFGNWVYEVAVTWESLRNGHWQIWYTYLDMSGGIAPVPSENFYVSFAPNPFRDNLKISYNLSDDQDVTLKVYNSIGLKVSEISTIKGYKGGNEYYLQGVDASGKWLPTGMYVVRLICKDGSETFKILKM